jgi:hypothetical protein
MPAAAASSTSSPAKFSAVTDFTQIKSADAVLISTAHDAVIFSSLRIGRNSSWTRAMRWRNAKSRRGGFGRREI